MELKMIELATGADSGVVNVSDAVFGVEFNESLVHQVVVAYMAGARSGTKSQKTRAEVRGGGIKPWRQKGTGRARAGTIRSPIWVGGGRAFPGQNRDFSQKVNKKMYRGAMRSILSELNRSGRLIVVDDFKVDAPKTREFKSKLATLNVNDVLVVTEAFDEYLYLSARNIYKADVTDAASVDPLSLVGFKNIILTQGAVKQLEEKFA
ncbi:50S ribosomal protein L4 [Thiomicrospira sp. R3]|uniref:50S ribosomal protein L4 n=1 Tax=Thiomicrospira sp. R3 TaxID=3035472 RepID=UPI00338E80E4